MRDSASTAANSSGVRGALSELCRMKGTCVDCFAGDAREGFYLPRGGGNMCFRPLVFEAIRSGDAVRFLRRMTRKEK